MNFLRVWCFLSLIKLDVEIVLKCKILKNVVKNFIKKNMETLKFLNIFNLIKYHFEKLVYS